MEKYADNLEELVMERTEQLIDEKKKTEALLERMLPKWVHYRTWLSQSLTHSKKSNVSNAVQREKNEKQENAKNAAPTMGLSDHIASMGGSLRLRVHLI